jgi:hypothetical protein
MPHDHKQIITPGEQTPAIVVARWLVVGLPQDLADALDRYAASLGPEVTPMEAARRILSERLLNDPSRLSGLQSTNGTSPNSMHS